VAGRAPLRAGTARRRRAADPRARLGVRRRGASPGRADRPLPSPAPLRPGAGGALSAGARLRAGEPLVSRPGPTRRRRARRAAPCRGVARRQRPRRRAARRERARRAGRVLPLRPRALGRAGAHAARRGAARRSRPRPRFPLELAPRGARAGGARPRPHLTRAHVVDHGRRGRGRGRPAGDGSVRRRALPGRPRPRPADRDVRRRNLRAPLRAARRHAVHPPGTGVRRAASRPARGRRARARPRPADLPGSTARSTGCFPSRPPGEHARRSRARAPGSSTGSSRISRTPIRATNIRGSSTG